MPSNLIHNAASATSAVLEQAAKAELLISHVTADGVNGFGVLANPLACKAELRAAQDEIEMAIAIMVMTRWPTDADYDRL